MNKYKLDSMVVTMTSMSRLRIVTQQQVDDYHSEIEESEQTEISLSVTDDLEKFFEELQIGIDLDSDVATHFFSKLTEDELKLVENRDRDYFKSFLYKPHTLLNPEKVFNSAEDVNETDNSKTRFVKGACRRQTFKLEPRLNNKSETKKSKILNSCPTQ